MPRYKLLIQYCGANFCGWQSQPHGNSVQDKLEAAFAAVSGQKVRIFGVGRTDEGVHARKYFAHLDTEAALNVRKLPLAMCAHLPPGISVLRAEEVGENFDARFSAKAKTYVYRLYVSATRLPLLDFNHLQIFRMPNVEKMQTAAKILEGTHDFEAFSKKGSSIKGTVRTLHEVSVDLVKGSGGVDIIEIKMRGNAFLYNMARLVAGALLWVGSGRLTLENIENSLKNKAREQHFKTLAPRGLTLEEVEY